MALGLGGSSSEPVPSVFTTAATPKLSEHDERLLVFFHTALRPGDKLYEVRRAFDKGWK